MPFYQYVALRVANHWNVKGNCALVAGATWPGELAVIRGLVGDMPLLLPGVGFQSRTKGETLEETVAQTVRAGKDSRGKGMIINSARGIIFASDGEDSQERVS